MPRGRPSQIILCFDAPERQEDDIDGDRRHPFAILGFPNGEQTIVGFVANALNGQTRSAFLRHLPGADRVPGNAGDYIEDLVALAFVAVIETGHIALLAFASAARPLIGASNRMKTITAFGGERDKTR
jgi:hypothetical protein